MVLAAKWLVRVNGQDMTDRMNPFLEEIECTAKAGGSADSARLVFDDTDGQVVLPPDGASVEIEIEGRACFKGFVDGAPESSGSRGGGMQLSVACKGFDKRGKVKQGQRWHKDGGTLGDFLGQAAKEAGLSGIKVDPEFAALQRDFWSPAGRNILQLGQALADELGGTFKIQGDKAVLARRGDGTTPSGTSLPTIYAIRPGNVRTWRIKPGVDRAKYTKARARHYDRKQSKWVEEDVEISQESGEPDAVDIVPTARADSDRAKQAAGGRKTSSQRERGEGSISMDLNVDAEVEGTCIAQGLRDGYDGTYRIEDRRHRITREGSETTIEVKQPKDGAGTDTRSKAGAASSASP